MKWPHRPPGRAANPLQMAAPTGSKAAAAAGRGGGASFKVERQLCQHLLMWKLSPPLCLSPAGPTTGIGAWSSFVRVLTRTGTPSRMMCSGLGGHPCGPPLPGPSCICLELSANSGVGVRTPVLGGYPEGTSGDHRAPHSGELSGIARVLAIIVGQGGLILIRIQSPERKQTHTLPQLRTTA